MSKIHVLLANDHLGIEDCIHGVGRLFSLWASRFDRDKFDITICILRKKDKIGTEFAKRLEETGVHIIFCGRGKFDPGTLWDFIHIIRKKKIDVMHLQAYGASTFGRLAGIIEGVPTIVHVHDDASDYPWYQKLADLILYRFTDTAIAVSESVKKACVRKRRIQEDRIIVMHNAVSLEKFAMPESAVMEKEVRRWGISPANKVVGTIAKLRKEKGVRYLLESVRKTADVFPETIFLIVGEGPLRVELESLTRQLKIENNVVFAGYCQNIPSVLSLFDIDVMPSLTEGSPLSLLEAMAMGKPIIATDVGGMREILKDGETGLLISPKDSEALAEKIVYLLKNKDKAKKLGMRAKEESRKYDVDLYMRKLEELYMKVASAR
jgi:glycosyltransferase involved in cell wall biosynthesis